MSPVYEGGGKILCNAAGKPYCDPATGKLVWKITTTEAPPTCDIQAVQHFVTDWVDNISHRIDRFFRLRLHSSSVSTPPAAWSLFRVPMGAAISGYSPTTITVSWSGSSGNWTANTGSLSLTYSVPEAQDVVIAELYDLTECDRETLYGMVFFTNGDSWVGAGLHGGTITVPGPIYGPELEYRGVADGAVAVFNMTGFEVPDGVTMSALGFTASSPSPLFQAFDIAGVETFTWSGFGPGGITDQIGGEVHITGYWGW